MASFLIFASLTGLSLAQTADFEYLQQEATVDQDSSTDVRVAVFSSTDSEVDTTLEILIDENGDGEYSDSEVYGSKDIVVEEYEEFNVSVGEVVLAPGDYSYTVRVENGTGYYYYPFEDGSLTVEGSEDEEDNLEPEIESIDLELLESDISVGDQFDLLVSTETESVVGYESVLEFDIGGLEYVSAREGSSNIPVEAQTSSDGSVTLTGQSSSPVDGPELAVVTLEAVEPGSFLLDSINSQISTDSGTFENVDEDELEINVKESSPETEIEEVKAVLEQSNATVEVEYSNDEEETLNYEEVSTKEAILDQLSQDLDVGYQKLVEIVEFENIEEKPELEVEVEIGDSSEVQVESSSHDDLNQEFELSVTSRSEVIAQVSERLEISEDRIERNIEFEEKPLEELQKETLVKRIEELRSDSKVEELRKENQELRQEKRELETEKEELKEEKEELRTRLSSTDSKNEDLDTGSSSSSDDRSGRAEENDSQEAEDSDSSQLSEQEEAGLVRRLIRIFN